jgi:hypothetical protein
MNSVAPGDLWIGRVFLFRVIVVTRKWHMLLSRDAS